MSNNFIVKYGLEVANGIEIKAGGLTVTGGDITLPSILRIGSSSGSDRFPNTMVSISDITLPIKPTELHHIGLLAEATSDALDSQMHGIGVYGVGYTAGETMANGVVGEAHVSDTTDIGMAIGVRGYTIDVHVAGANIGLYGAAANGLSNYALYMPSGDIYTGENQTWELNGDLTFSDSNTVTIPLLDTTTLNATTYNKVTITAPATGSTLTIADEKTLTASNTLTFTGTDSSSVNFSAGGDVVYKTDNLSVFAATTSSELAGVISDETGTGALVFANTPTLVTPDVTTSITTTSTTVGLFDTTATTVNFAGDATAISIGSGLPGATTINHDLQVAGNITFGGGTTQLSATVVNIDDTLLYLASNNIADIMDIGLIGAYDAGSGHIHTGFIRDASDSGTWKLFSSAMAEPDELTNVIDLTNAVYDNLKIGGLLSSSINKVTITEPATGSTLTIADGKTLTASNTLTFTGTDSSSVNFSAGGDVVYKTDNLSVFAATTSSELAGVISDETGTGALVFANTPTLVTPDVGVAIATSINKVAITAPATGSTLTIADGKTLTASNTLTFTGTDSSSVNFSAGGDVVYKTDNLSVFAATTSSELAGVISDETGTGALVFANTPTLVTPDVGVAIATSINKVAITAPATGSTLTLADSSTLATSGGYSLTLTATGMTNATIPAGTVTLVDDTVTTLSSLSTVGTITTGTWSGSFGTVSGSNLTAVNAYGLKTASGVVAVSSATAPTTGQVLMASDGTNAAWVTPAPSGVTSVGGTGTVNGLSLSGTVTSTGNLTLSGTLINAVGYSLKTSTTTVDVSAATAPSANQVLTATNGTAATWRTVTDLLGGSLGTVSSVGGTGTVNGLTLSGTVITTGSLTLGGTLSGVSLTSAVSGTLPVANGGTGVITSTGTGANVLGTSPEISTSLTTASTTFSLLTTNATTVNIATSATALGLGAGSGTTTVNNNLVVAGNFTVNGTNNIVNTTSLSVTDPIITMASGNTLNVVDIGIVGIHDSSTASKYTGFVRDASDSGIWKLFDDVPTAPSSTVDFTSATYAPIKVGAIVGTKLNNVTVTTPATGATLTLANNSTLTTAGNFSTAGAYAMTLTATAATSVTLPTSGTLLSSTATTFNKVAVTAPATSATLTLADGSTLATSGAFSTTLTATATTNVTLPTSGTLLSSTATTFNKVAVTAPATGATLTLANNSTLTTAGNFSTAGAYAMTLTATAATSVTLPTSGTLLSSTATTFNKVAVTAPATSATLTLADGSTLATSGAFSTTLTATATTNVTLPTSGTLLSSTATTFNKVAVTAPTTSATLTLADGSTLATSGAFSTTLTATAATNVTLPTSGTLLSSTATTFNKVAVTAPTTSATLTLADGSTLATSGAFSTTLTATAATNVTLPTSGTLLSSDSPAITTPTITGLKETKSVMAANAIDLSLGNYFTKTITAISTLTVSNVAAAGSVSSFVLDLTNGGAFAITWWTGVKWVAATAPTLTASGRDVLGFFTHDGGTTWTGLVLSKDLR